MKPKSGDWVVTIDLIQEAANTSLSIGSNSSLEQQHRSLLAEKGRQERLATSITDQMYLEAQVIVSSAVVQIVAERLDL
uniref:Uncharacterized protein n=1 Tax=Timema genevievae TaxID=629358 RepID=A0A7R9K3Q9_TIMGE|nr:unnamed protein product [Timema genevievae]